MTAAGKIRKFDKVHIEISNICNLHCSFCPEVARPKQLMELELFRRIIEQVAPLTEQVCFHLMGEPLTHPSLDEFIGICHERGVRIYLVTNGVLLREKQASLLLHPAFRQVNFSLHSFQDNFPDADPAPYLERIFEFTERAFEVRPELFINYRLWNLAGPVSARPGNLRALALIRERFGVTADDAVDVRLRKRHPLKNRLSLHFDTEFTWPDPKLPILEESGRCHGLSSHFGILVDGTVVPCCLDQEGWIPLGKVPTDPLPSILENPRAMAISKGFGERRLVEELCRRCPFIVRFG